LKWAPHAFVQAWHSSLSVTYDIVNVVGEGRSGAVFIVWHKRNEKHYACKFLQKADHDAAALRNEVETLRRLDHPNIVRLYEVLEDADTVFLLMELCAGGELFDKIDSEERLTEPVARNFAQQMLSALAYCHEQGVVHRDVKPENFLLETEDPNCSRLKLADFGIATSIRPEHVCHPGPSREFSSGFRWPSYCDESQTGPCGSLPYMAPETFQHNWRSLVRDVEAAASDLWSVGVVIYIMVSGEFPYGDKPAIICSGLAPDFSAAAWRGVSEEALDLIRRLLNPNPKERLTAQQALAHEWFLDAPPDGDSILLKENTPSLETFAGLEGCSAPATRRVCAAALLASLRNWRRMPKLRRIAIAAIAKRLETQHDMHRIAQALYKLFGDNSCALRCDTLAQALKASLTDAVDDTSNEGPAVTKVPTTGSSSSNSPASKRALLLLRLVGPHGPASEQRSMTGLRVRERIRTAVHRRFGPLVEETATPTPTPGSATSSARPWSTPGRTTPGETPGETPGTCSSDACAEALGAGAVSEDELNHLVASLDGMKNGFVDYTLLMASMLTSDVYGDCGRIADAFALFDLQKRGVVKPKDLCMALRGNQADAKRYDKMIEEFDKDGDGALNLTEFQDMIRCSP
jgi:serine/threonine protein kinase